MAEGNKNALPFGLCAKYKIELPGGGNAEGRMECIKKTYG